MENATKALEMAGSLLIGVLLLGCLLFAYTKMTELKDTEHKVEVSQQAQDFNQDYEAYNRNNLYGSEILSLANYVEDYNIRQSDLKGYKAISLNIYIKAISDATYFKKEKYTDYKELVNSFKNLEKEVNRLQNQQYCGETVKKLAGLTTEVLENYISQYNENNSKKCKYEDVKEAIDKYQAVNSELQIFKNKKFKAPNVEYDNATGRISSMTFREIGI